MEVQKKVEAFNDLSRYIDTFPHIKIEVNKNIQCLHSTGLPVLHVEVKITYTPQGSFSLLAKT